MKRLRFIESRQNPLIKEALKVKERKYEDYLLIEGEHSIEMAGRSRFKIKRVFFSKRYKNQSFLKALDMETELIETTEDIISLLSHTETPQGIVAIATYIPFKIEEIPERKENLLVVCDEIQDPGNLGTIIRTADATWANAVIVLPGTCDPLMPKVIRASAGSIFNVPVVFSRWDNLREWTRKRNIRLIVTSLTAKKTLYDLDLTGSLAFIFGNEARGVSKKLISDSDEVFQIPIIGKAESLNVSVAVSICLYEAVRQRFYSKPGT